MQPPKPKQVPEPSALNADRVVSSPFVTFSQLAENYYGVPARVLKRRVRRHGKRILPPGIEPPGCREILFEISDVEEWFRQHKRDYEADARAIRNPVRMKKRKSRLADQRQMTLKEGSTPKGSMLYRFAEDPLGGRKI